MGSDLAKEGLEKELTLIRIYVEYFHNILSIKNSYFNKK